MRAWIRTSSPTRHNTGVAVLPIRALVPDILCPLRACCFPLLVTVPTSSIANVRFDGTATHSLPVAVTRRYGAC